MGIRTKVIPLMKAAGQVPRFEATDDYVKSVLGHLKGQIKRQNKPNNASLNVNKGASANSNASLRELQQRTVKFIQDNNHISYDEIAVLCAKDKATVRRNIQKLKKIDRLESNGAKNTGYWRVLE